MDATIKFGVGLDGVLSESSDGLAFLGVGYKRESGATGILELAPKQSLRKPSPLNSCEKFYQY
ncbi:MAG: hypothetical protein IPI12_14135 [Ignavibacteriales bacterium]|nr:hypothetical protein [Ignavibacteriales bacterium]